MKMAWHHVLNLAGAMLPYMFAALTMISVGKAAAEIIMEVRDQFHNRPDLVAQDGKTTLKDCIIMASNGEPIPPHMDVIPDSNKCVAISPSKKRNSASDNRKGSMSGMSMIVKRRVAVFSQGIFFRSFACLT